MKQHCIIQCGRFGLESNHKGYATTRTLLHYGFRIFDESKAEMHYCAFDFCVTFISISCDIHIQGMLHECSAH